MPVKKNKPSNNIVNKGGSGDGVFYDKASKMWGFRAVRDGKDVRRKGFSTKTEAKMERLSFLADLQQKAIDDQKPLEPNAENKNITLQDVYKHYLRFGSAEKREATLKKQASMWENHLNPKFGNRPLISISSGELKNYLIELYYKGSDFNNFKEAYAFGYVEGFLKFFYLLFGYSRRQNWISRDTYSRICEDKGTKLSMPAKTKEEEYEQSIETYTREEIKAMMQRLESTNLYTAFLLGYYLGVRISEAFGLMWEDINWSKKTISIERQMLMQSPHRVLVPCKTTASKRVIEIPDKLYIHLQQKKKEEAENRSNYGTSYKATETVKVRIKKGQDDDLVGGLFINRQKNGQILTPDSMKSWGVKIGQELGISLKYHNLRHTHASFLAAVNTPIPKLMQRLGHRKIETTSKYYFGQNELSDEKMKENLNML